MKVTTYLWNRRITALAASGLMVIGLAGCSQGSMGTPGTSNSDAGSQGNFGSQGNAVGQGNASSANGNRSQGSSQSSNQGSNNGKAASQIALSSEPGKIQYGSYTYTIPVPATDKVGNLTHVTAIDVPDGVLWMTPTGFPDAARTPLASPGLWFTPASTKGGNIWNGAVRLHEFMPNQKPFIVGVTGGYAIVRVPTGSQGSSNTNAKGANSDTTNTSSGKPTSFSVVAYSVKDGRAVTIGTYHSGDQTVFGGGVFAWADTYGNVHVVQVNTGKRATIASPTQPSSLTLVAGGVLISHKFVPVTFVRHPKYPPLPPGFHWVYMGQAKYPVIQVPKNWTTVQQIPGGSSEGVIASNPADKNEKVSVYLNACAGCYDPTVVSHQLIQSFDSPLPGAVKGQKYVWLDDHAVAFTRPPTKRNPYPTYGLTLTFPLQSGDEEVEVTAPPQEKQLATDILNGVLAAQIEQK